MVKSNKDWSRFYITHVPNNDKPGFAGVNASSEIVIIFPNDFTYDPWTLFPYMNSLFLKIYFVLIVILLVICLAIYLKIRSLNSYNDFLFATDGIPWGAISSIVGVIVMFVFANPFGWTLPPSNLIKDKSTFKFLKGFLICVALACVAFHSIDFQTADFLQQESLIDTRHTYTLDRDEIADRCQFNQYDCSVYWSANLTSRDETCPDSYYLFCISYNSEQGSCEKGMKEIYSLFVGQGLVQFFLAVVWDF